jgi:hypothetical protein
MFQRSPTNVLNELISQALVRRIIGYPDELRLQRAILAGEPIPDICKPGSLLAKLNEEDKEALTRLTSDMARNYRVYGR